MAYTREQLNEAIQAKNGFVKECFELGPAMVFMLVLSLGTAVGTVTGIAAGIGTLTGLALSYVNLSPFIAGGIIGSVIPLVLFVIDACYSFRPWLSNKEVMSSKHQQILTEYYNSTEYKVKSCVRHIANIAVSFGIGAGLVALGLTSPAAICAVTLVAALAVLYLLGFVIDKVIECFFPDGSGKQPDSLVSSTKVDNADKSHSPKQPQPC
ncbi:hypothetical protein [Wolbachia endosymbiont of Ctenocephalides felis wCfeJ]|uniref:hypothetical protein n=1 Tax=Wolbachia endosymbiont of Ctenocephalides felis wCfeJ TaxID=2732594 RepID=UPI0014483EEB|nr:hypothetical protein [Wolbachia endosymbiont of Ctenocephalides felis wCfeJ]WCR58324.1 MAG: hypothetical protein PG980_000796 [Wolbachia endosymbiont of Ctenocephalides felis wCfeJ]